MKQVILLFLALFLIIASSVSAVEGEINYYTVYDQDREVVFYSAEYEITTGDRYIDQQNREYLVVEVDDQKREAVAEDQGTVQLVNLEEEKLAARFSAPSPYYTQDQGNRKVAIFHTHSEESFVPTSGTHDKPGEGDIFEVGEEFKETLEKMGISVLHSLNTHDPRDAASYDRSKPTARKLLEKNPDALFDIHRDGVPNREEYTTSIEGSDTAMVTFVVGRQNPNMAVNEEFAKELKAAADKMYPGLIKGILFANGKYNQELSPNSLLFEIGTHLNSLEEAQLGATYLAEVVADFLYGRGEAAGPGASRSLGQQRSALVTIFWILFVALGGGALFLYLNEGSWSKVLGRLKTFFKTEYADLLDRDDSDHE